MVTLLVLWFFVSTSALLAFCALAVAFGDEDDDWDEGRYERFTPEPPRVELRPRPYDWEAS